MNHVEEIACDLRDRGESLFPCLAGAAPLFAQSTTEGAVGGLVIDQRGASFPGENHRAATWRPNSVGEGRSPTLAGRFLVIRLQPGEYNVEGRSAGFATFRQDNVVVEVGRDDESRRRARRGRPDGERSKVIAQAPIVNTGGRRIFPATSTRRTIANLPTNTRRWSTFALMTPGAAPDGNFRPGQLPRHLRDC